MPHIRLRFVEPDLASARAITLFDRLTEVVGCERSWFTLEIVATVFIDTGTEEPARPFAEVLAFPRAPEVKKAVATILSEELRGDADYLTTAFLDIGEGNYFENGELV